VAAVEEPVEVVTHGIRECGGANRAVGRQRANIAAEQDLESGADSTHGPIADDCREAVPKLVAGAVRAGGPANENVVARPPALERNVVGWVALAHQALQNRNLVRARASRAHAEVEVARVR
jgi:hypothetical protein